LKKAREFELMPKFLDQVAQNLDSESAKARFAKELAGGLIGRFSHFLNVFRQDAYDKKNHTNTTTTKQLKE